MDAAPRILALSGGVGGAKLALGLAAELPPERLLVAVNTGDDFDHLGLRVCPDLDTTMYTLAGFADATRGWGLAGESWQCLDALTGLGGPDWFRLGDRDLATHLLRTQALAAGTPLSEFTHGLCARLGIAHPVTPVTDAPLRTLVDTDAGTLAFQHYFVRERCQPAVRGVRFAGSTDARPAPALAGWFADPAPGRVVICPSNPWLSVDPLLAVPGVREGLAARRVIAVSPIVGGTAIKGPAAKMMAELGLEVGVVEVARHYRGLVDTFVIDVIDAAEAPRIEALGMRAVVAPTVMHTLEDKRALARLILALDGPGA